MKVAIIGAGPAGISAALTLTSKNVHVTILDEQNTIGGQIYRNLETISEKKIQSLDIDNANAKLLFKRVEEAVHQKLLTLISCLLYTSPSPRDRTRSRMPSSA